MPAHEKVSTQQIVNALLKWGGNVSAAADELGVRRNNLDERIRNLGLDLEGFRKGGTGITPFTPLPVAPPFQGGAPVARKNGPALYPRAGGRPIIQTVSTAIAFETAAAAKKRTSPRMCERDLNRLDGAKYDLQALLRCEIPTTKIQEEFYADQFDAWIKRKIEEVRKRVTEGEAPPRSRGRKAASEDER